MKAIMPAANSLIVKTVGSNGQISLGNQFAGRQVVVEEREPDVWLVRTAQVIPDNECLLLDPKALSDLEKVWNGQCQIRRTAPIQKNSLTDGARNSEMPRPVLLDLNDPNLQQHLFGSPKPERHSAMETLQRLRRMNWDEVYRDNGLKWEKTVGYVPVKGFPAVYSVRLSQSRRAIAYRDGNFLRFLGIPSDYDFPYGRR
jgi:hypothetical protein